MLRTLLFVTLSLPLLLIAQPKEEAAVPSPTSGTAQQELLDGEDIKPATWVDLDTLLIEAIEGKVLLRIDPVPCAKCDSSNEHENSINLSDYAKGVDLKLLKTRFIDRPDLVPLRTFANSPMYVLYNKFPNQDQFFHGSLVLNELDLALNQEESAKPDLESLAGVKQKSRLLSANQLFINSASEGSSIAAMFEDSPVIELAFARALAGSKQDIEFFKRTLARGDSYITRMPALELQKLAGPVIKAYARGYRLFRNPKYLRTTVNTFRTYVEPVIRGEGCSFSEFHNLTQALSLANGLLELYFSTGNPVIMDAAQLVLGCIKRNSKNFVARASSVEGKFQENIFLVDNAILGNLYLDMFAATFDKVWLKDAEELAASLKELTGNDSSSMLNGQRLVDLQPVYARSLLSIFYRRLANYGAGGMYADLADKIIEDLRTESDTHFENLGASYLLATHFAESPSLKLTISGRMEDPGFKDLWLGALKFDAFSKVVRYGGQDDSKPTLLVRIDGLKSDPIEDTEEISVISNSFLARLGLKKNSG